MKHLPHVSWTLLSFSIWLMPAAVKATVSDIEKEPTIVYEVFVRSFCDSNGDGIGDIPGLISKLDYIRDLGATAIWLMPVHPSPSYHQYDVTDYYAIHPDLGTMEDMDRLIREVHQRGMKFILDLVINHTSSEHAWFKASAASPDNPYRPYYVWKDYESVKDALFKKSTTFDSDNLTQWHEWPGNQQRYYGFFWKGMPDLNFDHPPLREEVYKIGRFWLEKGVDGFRLDAAKHIYPDDQLDATRKFWEEFTSRMREIKPDVKIIGEVWADAPTLASLLKGLPSLFNFELTKAIPESILASDAHRFRETYDHIRHAYDATGTPYEDALLLCNHDMNRIRSTLGGDLIKSKLAASILLTLPGTAYLYYGEEIGMLGVKPDIHLREPFIWSTKTYSDTLWQKPQYSITPQVTPLDQQVDDPESIYQHYRKWMALRNEHPALCSGKIQFMDMHHKAILAYTITASTTTYWVVHNLGGEDFPIHIRDKALNLSDSQALASGDVLTLPGWSSVLVKMGG